MTFRTLAFLAIAFGLLAVSHSLGLRGDAAPFGENGVSPERAKYHLMAIVAVLASMGCFVAAGMDLFRRKRS
jgi:hypothetical protein